jgi:CheY-like chemotaxis protein
MSTILLVDDEMYRLKSLLHLLRQHGHELVLIQEADKALQSLKEPAWSCPELLIWDLMMPPPLGNHDPKEHAYGTRTGLLIHAELRRRQAQSPSLLYTHARDDRLLGERQRPPLDQAFRKSKVGDQGVLAWVQNPLWSPS